MKYYSNLFDKFIGVEAINKEVGGLAEIQRETKN